MDVRDATGAIVLTVRVGDPLPPATITGFKLQFGGTDVIGLMEQLRLTVELKPAMGVTVTVDIAVAPAGTVAGESEVASSAKDGDEGGGAVAVTVNVAATVSIRLPELPTMLKL